MRRSLVPFILGAAAAWAFAAGGALDAAEPRGRKSSVPSTAPCDRLADELGTTAAALRTGDPERLPELSHKFR